MQPSPSPTQPPRLPSFIRSLHGRIGPVVFKTYGRKIIATRVPYFAGYLPTPAQRARRQLLRNATKAFYLAAARHLGRQPFRLAVNDHLTRHPRIAAVQPLLPLAAAPCARNLGGL